MNIIAKLKRENEELRRQLSEAQDALSAIRDGHVDAIVVDGDQGAQVFSLAGAETVYRLAVETMSEATLNVSPDGCILFCNARFGEFVATPLERLVGRDLADFVRVEDRDRLRESIRQCPREAIKQRIVFRAADGRLRPIHLTGHALSQGDTVSICLVAADLSELENSAQQIDLLRAQQLRMENAQSELRAARRGALNLMEDAVAAREKAEKVSVALQVSEERYRTLFDCMAEGFAIHEIIVDGKGIPCDYRFLDINPSFEQQTGLKRSEVVGRRISEVLPGLDPVWVEIYGKVALTGESAHFENYANVLSRWFEVTAYRTVQHQFVTVFTDITERKQAELALEKARAEAMEEKNRLEAIMEALPVGVSIVDTQGGQIRSNPAYGQIWGNPPPADSINDYAAYKAWWVNTGQRVHPEEWASARAVQKGETVIGQLMEIERFDGKRAFVHNSATPIFDANQRVIGSAVAIMDVTRQLEAQEALRETTDYLQNLLDYANAPIIVWDPEFRITKFNRAFEFLTGRSAQDVIGQPLAILYPEETREESYALIRLTQTGERWETVEIPILRLDGSVRTVLWNSATLFAPDGKTVTATIAQGQDITERRRAEQEGVRYQRGLEFLADTATNFLRRQTPEQVFEYAAQKISELVAGGIVFANEFDPVDKHRIVRAFAGDPEIHHSIREILGREVIGLRMMSDAHVRQKMVPGALLKMEGGFRQFVFRDLSEQVCRQIEERIGRRDVYVVPLAWADDYLGSVAILADERGVGGSTRIIETFVTQAAIALNRLRTDEALRQREREYRTLMEEASDGIVLVGPDGNFVAANSKACELCGYTRDELNAMRVSDLVPPEDIPLLAGHVESVVSGKAAIVEQRLNRKGGSQVFVETSARRLADGRYQAIFRDISDRKRAEEEFTRAVQTEVFDKLFTALRELHHGEGLAMNLHRIALFARNYQELLTEPSDGDDTSTGKGAEDPRRAAHSSPRERLEIAVREYVTVGHPRLREIASLLRAVESDINENAAPGEQPVSASTLFGRSDVLQADLEELLHTVQPQESGGTGTAADLWERIPEHVESIFQIVADVTRQLKAHYTSDVSEVVKAIVPSFQSPSADVVIDVRQESADIKAMISPADLGNVLSILLTNSLEAPEGTGASGKRIVVRSRVDETRARIEVEDNGGGVPEEIRGRMFGGGVTTKGSGHGHGLSFAQKRLRKYGGTLTYDGRYKKGARFVIELVLA